MESRHTGPEDNPFRYCLLCESEYLKAGRQQWRRQRLFVIFRDGFIKPRMFVSIENRPNLVIFLERI